MIETQPLPFLSKTILTKIIFTRDKSLLHEVRIAYIQIYLGKFMEIFSYLCTKSINCYVEWKFVFVGLE